MDRDDFYSGLEELINRYSKENGSDTPDFILADYMYCCLDNFNRIVNWREEWYGRRKSDKYPSELNPVETKQDRDNCPCCNYPECDHDHSCDSKKNVDPIAIGSESNDVIKSCLIFYYNQMTFNIEKSDEWRSYIENETGMKVIKMPTNGDNRIETLYYNA